jgi:hypothetical protein
MKVLLMEVNAMYGILCFVQSSLTCMTMLCPKTNLEQLNILTHYTKQNKLKVVSEQFYDIFCLCHTHYMHMIFTQQIHQQNDV